MKEMREKKAPRFRVGRGWWCRLLRWRKLREGRIGREGSRRTCFGYIEFEIFTEHQMEKEVGSRTSTELKETIGAGKEKLVFIRMYVVSEVKRTGRAGGRWYRSLRVNCSFSITWKVGRKTFPEGGGTHLQTLTVSIWTLTPKLTISNSRTRTSGVFQDPTDSYFHGITY